MVSASHGGVGRSIGWSAWVVTLTDVGEQLGGAMDWQWLFPARYAPATHGCQSAPVTRVTLGTAFGGVPPAASTVFATPLSRKSRDRPSGDQRGDDAGA